MTNHCANMELIYECVDEMQVPAVFLTNARRWTRVTSTQEKSYLSTGNWKES